MLMMGPIDLSNYAIKLQGESVFARLGGFVSFSGSVLETDRLLLRPPIADDLPGYSAFFGDSEATRFIGGPQPPSVAWWYLRTVAGAWALDGFYFFTVIEKSTGAWIGRIGPIYPSGWPGREVGWGLLPAYWGKGYAKEAATAAMNFAFDALGWEQVIHVIDPGNDRSIALAKALGSRNTGPGRLPAPFSEWPVEIWAQSRDEWRSVPRRLAQK
jgi:RimJ/RimL family protein N-acetyltransferase